MLDLKALLSKILGCFQTTSTELNGSYNLKVLAYRRCGIVTLNVWQTALAAIPKGAWTTIGTLPEAYRPLHQVDLVMVDNNTSSVQNNTIQIRVPVSGAVMVWAYANGVSTNQLLGTFSYIGGGYLTSKFSNIFSHLERWWEHVRFEGFTCENINSLVWFGGIKRFLSTCKQQCNDGQHRANALYQIARRSLFSSLRIRNQDYSNQNRFSGNKNSGQSSHFGIYRPILLYVNSKRELAQFLRQQSRVLVKRRWYMDCKHRISCFWCGDNVRHRGYDIILRSNGGGMSNVGLESITNQNTQRNYSHSNSVVELHHWCGKHVGKIWKLYNTYCGNISSACWVQQFCRFWHSVFGNIVELYIASDNYTRECYGWLNRHRDMDGGWNIFIVDEVPNSIKEQFHRYLEVSRTITLERGWCCA